MSHPRIIALCGNSLFVAGLETCLKDTPEMEVVRIDAGTSEARARLQALQPDVIIFDGGDHGLGDLTGTTQLTRENPGALMISLDLASNNVTILSSQQHWVNKSEDIVQAIRVATARRELEDATRSE